MNIRYSDRKNEIYGFYNHFDKVDVDNIEEVNDHIVDLDLKKEHFDDDLEEFFNITSMCSYMIENNLYDEYFFKTFREILDDYKNGLFDNYDILDKEVFDNDLKEIEENIKKDEIEEEYYNNLTNIYDEEINREEE